MNAMLTINLRNRYPGARFDSESYSYSFSFSQEILDEWNWTEHFAPQAETLKYAQFVTEKLDLRQDMQFNTSVRSAHWQDASRLWLLTDDTGKQYTSRFLITCMGILNQPTYPLISGVHDFKGESFHTARWPETASIDGKRVGIIGTGATGIQTIQEIAKTVGNLSVFQRTPNWTGPLRNARIPLAEMEQIRIRYPEIFKACKDSASCFMHQANPQSMFDLTAEEREAVWEDLYAKPGFGKWLSNFRDLHFDKKANDLYSDWVANKIRQRVNDPVTAEKLIPKNHGFGTRRVPLETFYYEVFNQDNVQLVNLLEDPILRITETGIQTASKNVDLDVIIYATGFDAITGAFTAVDFRGVDGVKLSDAWSEGPRTQLGLTVHGFPNMMMSMGPHQMFGNIPRSIEYAVGWISDCIQYCMENGISRMEATAEGVDRWTEHVHKCADGLLANDVDSWMTGVNKNVAGKQKRIIARYQGPAPGYRKLAGDVAARNYEDFTLSY
jgi:cation diffusion facilitator CzcD-associated flavoprotein CzcO